MVNFPIFAVGTRLPVQPISRRGLIVNTIAAAAAWLVMLKGRRDGLKNRLARTPNAGRRVVIIGPWSWRGGGGWLGEFAHGEERPVPGREE